MSNEYIDNYDVPVVLPVSDDELQLLSTVSSKIRYLDKRGMKRADIARKLSIRYQHVKNVLDNPLKRS